MKNMKEKKSKNKFDNSIFQRLKILKLGKEIKVSPNYCATLTKEEEIIQQETNP